MTTYREEGPLYREDGTRVYADDSIPAEPVVVRRRRSGGGFLLGLIVIVALIVAFMFYTGFWSANVTQNGSLPKISVATQPGVLPKVDLQSKKIVIGTKKESVAVPTIGVQDNKSN
jgi:hypothetical protein